MARLFGMVCVLLGLCAATWPMGMEDFGNREQLWQENYPDYKGIVPVLSNKGRVYHYWCNGGEGFYFRGDTAALNEALRQWSAVEMPEHRVAFLPDKGMTRSFHGRRIGYDWHVGIQDGLAGAMLDHSKPHLPVMYVHLGGGHVNIEEVCIPAGIQVEDIWDLHARYREGLSHPNEYECTDAMSGLAGLGPLEESDVAAIGDILLHHGNQWVRACAASSLGHCGINAKSALADLKKALEDPDSQVKEAAKGAIDKITADKSVPVRENEEWRRMVEAIKAWKESLRH